MARTSLDPLTAPRMQVLVCGPISKIVAGFASRTENADVLVAIAGKQTLRLGICSGCVTDQHAVLGRDNVSDICYDALR